MNAHRIVAWLVIILIATPFLAIPEWLLQVVVAVLGLAIITTVWVNRPEGERSVKAIEASVSSPNNSGESTSDKSDTSESSKSDQNDGDTVDIEDPDADTMVAADRWRRRTSRDLS